MLCERNAFAAQFEVRWEFFCPNNIENIARPSGTLRAPMPNVIHFFSAIFHIKAHDPDRTYIEYCRTVQSKVCLTKDLVASSALFSSSNFAAWFCNNKGSSGIFYNPIDVRMIRL